MNFERIRETLASNGPKVYASNGCCECYLTCDLINIFINKLDDVYESDKMSQVRINVFLFFHIITNNVL